MIFEGQCLTVKKLDNEGAELNFDRNDLPINKLDQKTLSEFKEAITALGNDASIKGLLITSAKKDFIVGADITEFIGWFGLPENEFETRLLDVHKTFAMMEDFPFPTVSAINGFALGGGFELPLSTDYRIMTTKSRVGLPEINLGIFPGWGGSFRLPRLIGLDNAFKWIATGKPQRPDDALKEGAVDAVVAPDDLYDAGLTLLARCISGEMDYEARREEKRNGIKLNPIEQLMSFETARGMILGKAGPHYPAPKIMLNVMQKHANMHRDEAMLVEVKGFIKAAKTEVAANLVGLFLNDQALKRQASKMTKIASKVKTASVLGAGVMGGGIAYQSALKGTPITMKDISQDALKLGMKEAKKLLLKRVKRGIMTQEVMMDTLSRINTTLTYGDVANTDIVVEAVIENVKIKKSVLAELEDIVSDDTILASNTSTISITELATATKNPDRVCGMHFFNPVPLMPLVEVIRGEKTSDEAIATTVAYALAIGKKPIVVNDCPGFLVNRVLFPYLNAFERLLNDGADFLHIDKVMEGFGWPMGPAYLLDVVGLDVACHASAILAKGFPDRMKLDFNTATEALFNEKRLGQKSSSGYYRYEPDRRGKPKKIVDEDSIALVKKASSAIHNADEFSDDEIIERMMIALCLEVVRCLEDNIVDSPEAADMSLIWGIGFPPFRGGALRYIDSIGTREFVEMTNKYADLGATYKIPKLLADMASNDINFFGGES
ncbi:MAG TPA: fatty acid oxidation complex subunit alpha FadB [Leucothrix mucor]|nr:fatty acid oxidation complex subunit alpha FadB [Leucothrix mucor]